MFINGKTNAIVLKISIYQYIHNLNVNVLLIVKQ